MKWVSIVAASVLFLVLFGGMTTGDTRIQSPDELVVFVTEAGDFLKKTGFENVSRIVPENPDIFIRNNSAISVYDINGTLLAYPNQRVDMNAKNITETDIHGLEYIRLSRDIALRGGGYALFIESERSTQQIHSSSPTRNPPALMYVFPVDAEHWISSQVLLTDLKNQQTGEPALAIIENYVHDAADYAREMGYNRSIQEFNDLNGSFTHGSWYIYAFDMNGTFLASPYYPQSIGTNQSEVVREYGVSSVAEMIKMAEEQPSGYEAFVILNPDTNQSEVKLGYYERVDNSWFVGSGWYVSDLVRSVSPEK